jgi:hypothetical protein
MKKTLVSFTISFACLIGFCTFANADMLPSWNITTKDENAWKITTLLIANDTGNATTQSAVTEAVFKNYVDGYSTILNSEFSRGGKLSYGNAKDCTIGIWANNWGECITASDAYAGYYESIYPNLGFQPDPSIYLPGYYAFQTEILSPEISDLSGLFLNVNLEMKADNFLEGIFLNGQEITKYSSLKGATGLTPNDTNTGNLIVTLELTGSVSLDYLIDQGLFLTDGTNTLEFVIRNGGEFDNPFHFGALGEINIGDQQFDHSFNPTPEPATLLICLTCGGLALAIRRRKNKKTE